MAALNQPNLNYAQQVFWDEAGNPYWDAPTFKKGQFTGNQRMYFAPQETDAQTVKDPKLRAWAAAALANKPRDAMTHGEGLWDTKKGGWITPRGDSLYTLGIGGFLGAGAGSAAGLFGGAGPAASAGAGSTAAQSSSVLPAKLGADAAPSLFGGGGGMLKGLGGFLKGIDPTSAVLGGLSLLGGGGDGQRRRNFTGAASPQAVLQRLLDEIDSLGGELRSRGPARLSAGSVVQPGIKPVNIPGLPFQIGGGLAQDPAISDPSILESKRGPKLRKL